MAAEAIKASGWLHISEIMIESCCVDDCERGFFLATSLEKCKNIAQGLPNNGKHATLRVHIRMLFGGNLQSGSSARK